MDTPRSWSELDDATSWTETIDGFAYRLREPSVVRLLGKGIELPVVAVEDGRAVSRNARGEEKAFYLSEKEQREVLADCLIEPVIGKDVPSLDSLGSHADILVIAIIKRIYGGALVRAASFRREEGEGAVDRADGEVRVDGPALGALPLPGEVRST